MKIANSTISSKKHKKCSYCGNWGESRDHIVPFSFFSSSTSNHKNFVRKHRDRNIVSSCNECNTIAGNNVFDSYEDKKKFIAEKLKKKYSNILSYPEWTEKEMAELGFSLREQVKRHNITKKIITYRLENLNENINHE